MPARAPASAREARALPRLPHALGASVCRSARFHFHSSTATYHDVTYRFASAEHQAMFEKDSGKFEPQFGGYCAYGVAMGHTSPVKVDAFQIVDGRLLMQYDTEVGDTFNKDQKRNLQTADKIWPTLSASSK